MHGTVPQFHDPQGTYPQSIKMMPSQDFEDSVGGEDVLSVEHNPRSSGGYGEMHKARSIQAPHYRIT